MTPLSARRGWMRQVLAGFAAMWILGGCAGPSAGAPAPESPPSTPAPASPPGAPWSGPPLSAAAVPEPYLRQWRAAENRASCALIAPADLGGDAAATPRAATFAGGWAVAYDLPDLRSAFGVAGTGVVPSADTYDDWPYRVQWADGSSAGYGPEGGTGPNQLAYLRVAGQECLYNVWSRIGVEHLERLLAALRYVTTG